jgi:hypothetical protein
MSKSASKPTNEIQDMEMIDKLLLNNVVILNVTQNNKSVSVRFKYHGLYANASGQTVTEAFESIPDAVTKLCDEIKADMLRMFDATRSIDDLPYRARLMYRLLLEELKGKAKIDELRNIFIENLKAEKIMSKDADRRAVSHAIKSLTDNGFISISNDTVRITTAP